MRIPARATLYDAGCFVLVSFITRAVVLGAPVVDIDESSHLAAAWIVRSGGHLYLDAADHKPPLVFLYYALTQAFGHGMLAVRLITHTAWVPLTAFAVSRFHAEPRVRRTAGLIFLLASVSFFPHDTLAINTELLGLLPLAVALVVLRSSTRLTQPAPLALAGALIGLAYLFRYQLGVALPAIALGALMAAPSRRVWLTGVLGLVAGFLAVEVIAWATFALRGLGDAYLYWNFTHNLTYASSGLTWGEAIRRIVRYPLPLALILAPLLTTAWHGRTRLEPSVMRMLWTLIASVFAAGFLGWRVYPHYFIPLVVPLAIAGAPRIASLLASDSSKAGRLLVGYGVGIVLIHLAAAAWLGSRRTSVNPETRPVFAAVANRLRADACYPGARLFVWGYAPTFYTASDLLPASRFLYVDNTLVGHVSGHRGLRPDLIRTDHWDQLMFDLERHRPAFILDAEKARLSRWSVSMAQHPRIRSFVQSRYDVLAVVDRVVIYRRRGCADG